jgi:hypothetical protein
MNDEKLNLWRYVFSFLITISFDYLFPQNIQNFHRRFFGHYYFSIKFEIHYSFKL